MLCWGAVAAPGAGTADAEAARPLVSPIFGDGMVLQGGGPIRVWGWTAPGERVRVTLGGRAAETRANEGGAWEAAVDAPRAGGPYELQIDAARRVVLRDVLVGEVWLCGGQSNMALPLSRALRGAEEAKGADYPRMRFYTVGSRPAYAPVELPRGDWRSCTPETAAELSAVAYFFGRRLQRELDVPVGLIVAAQGGSPAESWMSAEAAGATGELPSQLTEIERLRAQRAPELGSFLMHWLAEHDQGGRDDAWANSALDDASWKAVDAPRAFAELGVPETPSVVWLRREVALPDPLPEGEARIKLGQIEKMDTTYVNGRWVGASSWVENPRSYLVPRGLLKPGRNLIAIRVLKLKPSGGFIDGTAALKLEFAAGTTIPLADGWRAKVSVDARPPYPLPLDLENYPTMPTVLYNGMIAPLARCGLAGALWYQGEANTSRAAQYRKLLPALIGDWRATFRRPEMPFYVVSLPAFMARRDQPGTDGWAELRAAQAETVRAVPNTGLAVTVDTGDANDIHPAEKQPVGERLAALALGRHYKLKVPFAGPTLRATERIPGALRLHFDHADGGLKVQGDTLGEFSVAGADRVWHWATARIEGDAVIVAASAVSEPVAARYAWQANPRATLFNGAGFPAAPFRSDDWPLGEGR